MNTSIKSKTTTPPLFLLHVIVCFWLAPMVQAVGPDTEGSIPGSNNGEGIGVLVSRTTGVWNSGTGFEALNHLTAGNQNTATGVRALFNDTSGGFNTATGVYSLYTNTTGSFNSATGAYSLAFNTTGSYNTANGYQALHHNTGGNHNVANGYQALYNNTIGTQNTANGYSALYNNTTGSFNTATGFQALLHNTGGSHNSAFGWDALPFNSGSFNTAIGDQALLGNTNGEQNTAVGFGALIHNTTGSFNIAVGLEAGDAVTSANNVICIGWNVIGANVDNSCFIGNIRDVTTANADAIPVVIDSAGQLGTMSSSRRFKNEIKPMDSTSEAILALKPVTFHYKNDTNDTPQFGLIAEEVAEVNPDLVVRDKDGEIYSVRYEAVNAMLLNEFLKEYRKVEEQSVKLENQAHKIAEQEVTITELKKEMKTVVADLKEQNSKIQKVSVQIELSKPAPQITSLSAAVP